MLPSYAKAFFSQPPTVFGKRLRPFSLGHSFLLEAIGNPVAMCEPYAAQDAAVFALVCSLPWGEALALLNDWDAHKASVQSWGEECGGSDWAAECAKIDAYFQEALECIPPRWDRDDAKTECKVPIQLAFFHILKGDSAITPEVEAAIWDMPFGRAAVYSAAAGWAKGDDTLMTEKEHGLYMRVLEMQKAGAA